MEQALDHFNENPKGFVLVNEDKMFIDPRDVGNDAQYVNHSCDPNAELKKISVGDRIIVLIVALRCIQPNEEVYIDYRYESHRTNKPIFCYCGRKLCRFLFRFCEF